jgi:5-methylcytosine-specific restriction endonuclease McrA
MVKCQHGVYWVAGHPIAFGCQFCNPDSNADFVHPEKLSRKFVMPRIGTHESPLGANPQANRGDCPQCHSGFRYVSGNQFQCADCETLYKPAGANA